MTEIEKDDADMLAGTYAMAPGELQALFDAAEPFPRSGVIPDSVVRGLRARGKQVLLDKAFKTV